jgi:hypothetical protein
MPFSHERNLGVYSPETTRGVSSSAPSPSRASPHRSDACKRWSLMVWARGVEASRLSVERQPLLAFDDPGHMPFAPRASPFQDQVPLFHPARIPHDSRRFAAADAPHVAEIFRLQLLPQLGPSTFGGRRESRIFAHDACPVAQRERAPVGQKDTANSGYCDSLVLVTSANQPPHPLERLLVARVRIRLSSVG